MKRKSSNDNQSKTDPLKQLEENVQKAQEAQQTIEETKKVVGDAKKIIEQNIKENNIPKGDELLNNLVMALIKVNNNCMTCALRYTSVVEDYKKIGQDIVYIANLIGGDLKSRGKLTIEEQLNNMSQGSL